MDGPADALGHTVHVDSAAQGAGKTGARALDLAGDEAHDELVLFVSDVGVGGVGVVEGAFEGKEGEGERE